MAAALSGRVLAWGVPLAAEAAALGRSVVLARMVGPDELGRAMLLALTLRLAEMISDIGIERLLVQSPRGDAPGFVAALQGAAALRGLAIAALMLALAWPMSAGFADGPAVLAYAALALVPLMRGLSHLDYRRMERAYRYGPMAVVEGGAALAMLLGAVAGALVLGDHRAIVAALLTQGLAHVALSHVVAGRAFALGFDGQVLREAWGFGAPLILNAGLMFLTFQADRLIVAGYFTWDAVALYAVAFQLALLPAQITSRAAASLLAPRMRDALAQGALPATARTALGLHALMAASFALGFALLAPVLVALVYGAELRPDMALATGLALAAGFRILRTPLSQLALVTGRTGDPARANLWRAAALIPALGCAAAGLPLAALAWAAAMGEAAATARALALAAPVLRPHPVSEVPA